MNLQIEGIRDPGNLAKERVVFKALKDIDIGYYIVFSSISTGPDQFSSGVRHTFWFPDQEVRANDLVVLYTKSGNSSKLKKDETTSYFFYWGLSEPIFKVADDLIVLTEARTWNSQRLAAKTEAKG